MHCGSQNHQVLVLYRSFFECAADTHSLLVWWGLLFYMTLGVHSAPYSGNGALHANSHAARQNVLQAHKSTSRAQAVARNLVNCLDYHMLRSLQQIQARVTKSEFCQSHTSRKNSRLPVQLPYRPLPLHEKPEHAVMN